MRKNLISPRPSQKPNFNDIQDYTELTGWSSLSWQLCLKYHLLERITDRGFDY